MVQLPVLESALNQSPCIPGAEITIADTIAVAKRMTTWVCFQTRLPPTETPVVRYIQRLILDGF